MIIYRGLLDCNQVPYIIGSCLGGVLLGVVVAVALCKRRKRKIGSYYIGYPAATPSSYLSLYRSHGSEVNILYMIDF